MVATRRATLLRTVALASVVAQHAVGGFTGVGSQIQGRIAHRHQWAAGVGGVGPRELPTSAASARGLALHAQPQKGSTMQGDQLDGPRPAEFKPEDAIDATGEQ